MKRSIFECDLCHKEYDEKSKSYTNMFINRNGIPIEKIEICDDCTDKMLQYISELNKYDSPDKYLDSPLAIDPYLFVVKIRYFDQEIPKIEKIDVGDWIDLRCAERVELKAGEYKLLRLGVGMILPDGYEALVLPRSSTPKNFGIILANSMGVIDNSYSGDADEWRFPALAIRDTVIEKGERIAQFRIIKNQPSINIEIVEHLNDVSRGGIGSTGRR